MSDNIAPLSLCPITTVPDFNLLFLAFLFYLIGSIPFGLILTKISGHGDIRKIGSGNIGTTNVLRTGNKFLAALTLLLDGLKGFSPLLIFLIILWVSSDCDDKWYLTNQNEKLLFYGLIAILGHCFPIWLKFKGGKGVATAFGALLAAVPYAGLAAAGAWIVTAFLFKISSLAALVAVGVAPIVTFFVYGAAPATVCLLITLLVWFRHKDNIKRLMAGTEPKIGAK